MLATFLAGGGAVSVLAREVGADLVCVDAGVAGDTSGLDVIRTGLSPSANLARDPALPRDVGPGRDRAWPAARRGGRGRRRDGPRGR